MTTEGDILDRFEIGALLLGFPKCASTSLAAWIDTAPDVSVSSPKETFLLTPQFGRQPVIPSGGPFTHAPKHALRLEASTLNIYSDSLARAVADRPHIRAIVAFRQPWDALPSWHNQMVNAGLAKQDELEELLADQAEPDVDHAYLRNYRAMLSYGTRLEHWVQTLGHDRLLILKSEQLRIDVEATAELIGSHLGCNLRGQPTTENAFHKRRFPKLYNASRQSALIKRAVGFAQSSSVGNAAIGTIKRRTFEQEAEKPPIDSKWETSLAAEFSLASSLHAANLEQHRRRQ